MPATAETIIEPLNVNELSFDDGGVTTDTPPKRGRGRPKGSTNRTNPASTTASGGSRTVRKGSRAWISEQCSGIVATCNLALYFVSKDDTLTEPEMTLVSDALTAEAMSSERISRWLSAASSITPHILLFQCVVRIAVPRLQRRGILPAPRELTQEQYNSLTPEQKAAYDEYLRNRASATTPAPESGRATDNAASTVPMEARGTSQFDGGYR